MRTIEDPLFGRGERLLIVPASAAMHRREGYRVTIWAPYIR
jgi:hypothetical protein